MNNIRLIVFYTLSVYLVQETQSFRFNFNKITCNATDPSFVIFEKYILKPVSRNNQYIKLYAKLLQVPITDIKARFQFVKRANGWKPFMYDITVRCDFLKKINPVTKLIWSWVKDLTNIEGSCPFNHDIEIYKLENTYISSKALVDLPVPSGEYGLLIHFVVHNISRAIVNFYGTIY